MGYAPKWIYTQRPRKFFTKERTNPGDSFETGTDSGTKVAGRAGAPKEARQRVDRYFEEARRARAVGSFALLGIALLLGWLAYTFYSSNAQEYRQDEHLKARQLEALRQQQAEERQNAYLLLMDSGDAHFQKREFEQAIEEYSRAVRIFPDAREPLIGVARSYQYLCEYYEQHCKEAELYRLWMNR